MYDLGCGLVEPVNLPLGSRRGGGGFGGVGVVWVANPEISATLTDVSVRLH